MAVMRWSRLSQTGHNRSFRHVYENSGYSEVNPLPSEERGSNVGTQPDKLFEGEHLSISLD